MTKSCKIYQGRGFDLQKLMAKTGNKFHQPSYQYMGPGTKLKKRLKDCQAARYRLQSCQESEGQVEGGQEDDQGHRQVTRKNHASQENPQVVKRLYCVAKRDLFI